jgi:hypothetical protein
MKRADREASAQFENSFLCFVLARLLVELRDHATAQGAPIQYQHEITLKPGALLEKLRSAATPENAPKLPQTSKQLFKALRELAPALTTRQITAERRLRDGHRFIYLTFPPPSVYPSEYSHFADDFQQSKIRTDTRQSARATPDQNARPDTPTKQYSKDADKPKKRLVEACYRSISAREAAHEPTLITTATPITGSAAAAPYVLCPVCNLRRRRLYQPTPDGYFACVKCADLAYRSSQTHATAASFDEDLFNESSEWFKRWRALFYPAYIAAVERNEDGHPDAHARAESEIGATITATVKAEWTQAQRTAKKPRRQF